MLAAFEDQRWHAVPVRRAEVWLFVTLGSPLVPAVGEPPVRWLAMMAKKHRAWLYPYIASG
ncbi:hypothetical protein D9M72_308180 [compost metagenome]